MENRDERTGATGQKPQQILLGELGTYYLGDELRLTADFTTTHAEWIADSAERMRAVAGGQGVDGLVALLRELRENRQHPLYQRIGNETLMDWDGDDASFAIFQQLVDRWIEDLLERSPTGARSGEPEAGE